MSHRPQKQSFCFAGHFELLNANHDFSIHGFEMPPSLHEEPLAMKGQQI